MPVFRDIEFVRESLDRFHQRCVVPTPDETRSRNAEIDAFVRFLHTQFNKRPYTVARVLKSGSLGKGTAVRGSADIDLVVILNGLSSISDLTEQRSSLLDNLSKAVTNYEPWQGKVRLENRTRYSLCYTLNGQEVDLLPALDITGDEYGGAEGVYKAMKTHPQGKVKAAQEFSASLAPLQIDFVKPQREEVKRVIRLLKLWKKERGLTIRSYTLELLTIHTARTGPVDTEDLFRKVLSRLQDCGSLKVAFDDKYKSDLYTGRLQSPYVLDPANPYMDTLHGVDVDSISREATQMLHDL